MDKNILKKYTNALKALLIPMLHVSFVKDCSKRYRFYLPLRAFISYFYDPFPR